jgi:hypothetical protein
VNDCSSRWQPAVAALPLSNCVCYTVRRMMACSCLQSGLSVVILGGSGAAERS